MSDDQPKFERAPYSPQIFTPENRKKFNDLPDKIRMFAGALLEHGNIALAMEAAGITESSPVLQKGDITIPEAIEEAGLTSLTLIDHLRLCLDAKKTTMDKKGNQKQSVDLNMKIRALDMIFKLRGDYVEPETVLKENVLELFENNK